MAIISSPTFTTPHHFNARASVVVVPEAGHQIRKQCIIPSTACRQTSAYSLGRQLEAIIRHHRTENYAPAVLLSESGKPASNGLYVRTALFTGTSWYSEPTMIEELTRRVGDKADPLSQQIYAMMGCINMLFHGSDFVPVTNRFVLCARRGRYINISIKGSNVFLVSRTLYHGYLGMIRDVINFAAAGYKLKDVFGNNCHSSDIRAALLNNDVKQVKKYTIKVIAALTKFRENRLDTSFGAFPNMFEFLIKTWGGYKPFFYNASRLQKPENICSLSPAHGRYPLYSVRRNSHLHGNILPPWTTNLYAIKGWWESFGPRVFTKNYETKFHNSLEC